MISHEIAPVLPILRIERPSELSWRARHGGKKIAEKWMIENLVSHLVTH